MNSTEGFVHLYHVWGVWGLITALIYGPDAWRSWRASGGTLRAAPGEYAQAFSHHLLGIAADLVRLLLGIVKGLFSVGPTPPAERPSPWRYSSVHMLTLGITLGGIARLITAFYWSEKNRGWMTDDNVWLPAIPVLIAVIADAHHHFVQFSDRPWLPRWIKLTAAAWIFVGLLSPHHA